MLHIHVIQVDIVFGLVIFSFEKIGVKLSKSPVEIQAENLGISSPENILYK